MNYLDLIKRDIENSLDTLLPGEKGIKFGVDIPELEHGDVTTNICLVAAKVLGKSPREVYELIAPQISSPNYTFEFKNPGFINFWLKKEFIRRGGKVKEKENLIQDILSFFGGDKAKKTSKYSGQKILVEHTQPNLFKAFTVGHLMNNFIGEFLVRILKEFGAEVTALSYPSDKSIGIAKAIYVLKRDGGLNQDIFKGDISEIVKYFGECYRLGVTEYKKLEEGKDLEEIRKIKVITNNIFKEVGEDFEIFKKCKEINIQYFESIINLLKSHIDQYIYESESAVEGKSIILNHLEEKVFKKSEGAIIYEPSEERKDINTTVFVNSEGNPTYAGKDVGLLSLKFKKFNPEISYFITDNEQIPHFKVVLDAASKINKEWSDKSLHLSHGRMTFKGQKMSSRLGGVPGGEEVIDTILEAVNEKSGERNISEDVKKEIALSALRIAVLRAKPGVNIDFDPEKALSFEGDSGPYLCYTSARLHSLLQKGKENKLYPGCQLAHDGPEIKLERKLVQFETILQTVVNEIAPQKLVTYLFELTGEFNHFYNSTKIIVEGKENRFESEHYLFVVQKTLNVLTKGLYLLGINAPERM